MTDFVIGSTAYRDFLEEEEDYFFNHYGVSGDLSAYLHFHFSPTINIDNELGGLITSDTSAFNQSAADFFNMSEVYKDVNEVSSVAIGIGKGAVATAASKLDRYSVGSTTGMIEEYLTRNNISAADASKYAGQMKEVAKGLALTGGIAAVGFTIAKIATEVANNNAPEAWKTALSASAGLIASSLVSASLGQTGFLTTAASIAFLEGSVPLKVVTLLTANPLIVAALSVGAGIGAAYLIEKNWDDIVEFVDDGADFLSVAYSSLVDNAENTISDLYDALETPSQTSTEIWTGFLSGATSNNSYDGNVSTLLSTLKGLFIQAENARPDPLVLDLDGNNQIDLNNEHTVYFDTDSDGFAEAVNWVAATDGLLARDVNSNGTIDNNSELFGNATEDGFSILSSFDLNSDYVIDSNDAIWADLVVWQDVNQDGYSQSDELLTLTSLGIISINLNSVVASTANPSITHNGTVTTTTGTMKISNVLFDADFVNTRYVDEYTLDIDTLFLPTLRGYGTMADLHIAASINVEEDLNGKTLKERLTDFATKDIIDLITNYDQIESEVVNIAYQWAGVIDEGSRWGPHYPDGRPLSFLEQYINEEFRSTLTGATDVGPAQILFIDRAFTQAAYAFQQNLVLQAYGSRIFEGSIQYSINNDAIEVDNLELSQDFLDEMSTYASGLSTQALAAEFWSNFAKLLGLINSAIPDPTSIRNDFALTLAEEALLDDAISTSYAGLRWYEEEHNVSGQKSIETIASGLNGLIIYGTTGGDTLNGSAANDRIMGGDHISSVDGNDIINGYAGADTISGGNGADLIYAGDGEDRVLGGQHNDTIYGGDGDDELYGDGAIVMGNDTIYGEAGNDYIQGDLGNDIIYGGDGNDELIGDLGGAETMYGVDEDDFIDGGAGNDVLFGGDGDDILVDGYGTSDQNLMDGEGGYNTYRIIGGGSEVWIDGGDGVLEVPAAYTDENDLEIKRIDGFLHITGDISGHEINVYIRYNFPSPISVDTIRFASSYELDLQNYLDVMNGVPTNNDDILYSANTTPGNTYVDTIYALNGNDIVYGDGGADKLYGDNGNDTLYGEAGADRLYGGAGLDILYGGADGDFLYGNDGSDILYGEAGGDSLIGDAGNDFLYGGDGNDGLSGAADNDFLYGGGGNDGLSGGSGDDTYVVTTGDGTDSVQEAPGGGFDTIKIEGIAPTAARLWTTNSNILQVHYSSTDVLNITGSAAGYAVYESVFANRVERVVFDDETVWNLIGGLVLTGTNGSETGYGTQYADTIYGLGNTDSLYGNRGNDTVYGGDGNDAIYGGDNDDTLYGDAGNDNVTGDSGNDHIYGNIGNDNLSGGTGDDTYYFSAGDGSDFVNEIGAQGSDKIVFTDVASTSARLWTDNAGYVYIYSGSDVVRITGGHVPGTTETNIASRLEQVLFSDSVIWSLTGGLTLTGSNSNDTGYGSLYADTIYGMGGGDTLYGYRGNDTFYGGDGADIVHGGDGDDILYGDDGNDQLNGQNGSDTIYGGAGNDTMSGGADNDTYHLSSGFGLDTITEGNGQGTDSVIFNGISSSSVRAWTNTTGSLLIYSGTDVLTITGVVTSGTYEARVAGLFESVNFTGDSVTWTLSNGLVLTGTSSNDTGYGSHAADTIYGLDGGDTLYGYRGNDTIYAGNGNDSVFGGDGNDLIYADAGTDTIRGEAGNDTLVAGDGADTLIGGADADTFLFVSNTTSDIISDFNVAQGDIIDISDLLIGYDPLTHAITDWVEITTSGSNSILKIDADGGANSFVQIAQLNGVTGLTDEAALVTSGNLVVT